MFESVKEVLHRTVMSRRIPTNVGIANAGKKCIVILGHKEVQDHKIELLAEDTVYTCVADSKGRLSSIGPKNVGKDVTVPTFRRSPQKCHLFSQYGHGLKINSP